jgi:YbgC/YbaW family acyl-CoA thioester hydrolase
VTGAPFEFQRKLYLVDTDATGIAYHSRHLEWMEAARVELIAQVYKPLTRLIAEDGVSFVPIHVGIDYKTPALFGDTVKVRVAIESFDRLKMNLVYRIVKDVDGQEALVAEADVMLVCVDVAKGSRPTRIPAPLAEALAAWQSRA